MSQSNAQLAHAAGAFGAAGVVAVAASPAAAAPLLPTVPPSATGAAGTPPPPRASAAQVGSAVFWSFIGIRKRSGHENDVARITPAQAIVAGLIGAALFVTSLIVLVKILTAK